MGKDVEMCITYFCQNINKMNKSKRYPFHMYWCVLFIIVHIRLFFFHEIKLDGWMDGWMDGLYKRRIYVTLKNRIMSNLQKNLEKCN